MPMVTLLIATNNAGKVRELAFLLRTLPVRIARPKDLGLHLDVAETGSTYAENARLKALAFAAGSGAISLADDSGLEIAALNGWPGIYSSRAAGPGATDQERRALVLERLAARSENNRRARFVCHVALAGPTGILAESEGVTEGRIALTAAGTGGFGFDPIFIPEGFDRTFAELPPRTKNEVSHRARAVEGIRSFIERLVSEE